MPKITFKYEPDEDDSGEDIAIELSIDTPFGVSHAEVTDKYSCFMQAVGYTYLTKVGKLKDIRES